MDLELEAREFLDWWSENRSATFSLTEVAVRIHDGRNFSDADAALLSAFFDENASPVETVGNITKRWAAV